MLLNSDRVLIADENGKLKDAEPGDIEAGRYYVMDPTTDGWIARPIGFWESLWLRFRDRFF